MSLLLILGALLVLLVLMAFVRVVTRPAFRQRSDQVVIRRPGQRMFGAPEPLGTAGLEDLPFAFLSQAAYQHKPDAKQEKAGDCVDPDAALQQRGWARWADFGGPELRAQIEAVHLRVEVWWHLQEKKVAVAFGGTVFSNIKDLRANLRWFLPHKDDEYTVIVKVFGRAFEQEYANKLKEAGWQQSDHIQLFSTGHSLGGGLAQEFAYSLPLNNAVPRVDKVYAIDPSPVTGFYSVEKTIRNANVRELKIDRIFERGEILAFLRSIVSLFVPPRRRSPTIRQIRYNLFPSWNPITGHLIAEFVCTLAEQLKKLPQGTAPGSRAAAGR
ncbi:MAG: lipase family protein [Terriglobales bacterium]